jgi:protein-S-isoprenylcysteine O-methyltransferase Ste14
MNQSVIDSPGVRIPPPLIFVGGLIVGLSMSAWIPTSYIGSLTAHTVGGILMVMGALLAASAVRIFVKTGTNLRPDRPSNALAIVGPYRFTRNPMYLSLTIIYVGVAVFMQSLWSVLLLPLLLFFIQRKIISREEAYLDRRFGADYTRYRNQVRRWL